MDLRKRKILQFTAVQFDKSQTLVSSASRLAPLPPFSPTMCTSSTTSRPALREKINAEKMKISETPNLLPSSLQHQRVEEGVSLLYCADKQVPLVESLLGRVGAPGSSILLQMRV